MTVRHGWLSAPVRTWTGYLTREARMEKEREQYARREARRLKLLANATARRDKLLTKYAAAEARVASLSAEGYYP